MSIFETKTSLKAAYVVGIMLLGTTALTNQSFAQVDQATRSADPARAAQDIINMGEVPQLSQSTTVSETNTQNAPNGAENIIFVLDSIKIDGVGAYTTEDLDPVYRDKLGTTVSLADIYAIANTLTTKYRNDGYILTQVVVPPQTIDSGAVNLKVIEGFVDQINIEGLEKESEKYQILKYADNLRENNILDAKNLERYLLLINDLPGVTARSILSPSKSVTGASDLTIIVTRDYYEGEVSFDNHGSRYLGPYQASYSGALNSVLGFNERIAGQFLVGGDKDNIDEIVYGSISYQHPLSRFGSKLNILGSITETEPGFTLDPFDVEGESKFLSIGVSHPFIRSRTTNFYGRASIDMRNVTSENNLTPNDTEDRTRSVRLGTTYQFMDSLIGVGINGIDLEVSHGIDIFGASSKGDANLTRALGNPKYLKAELQLQRLQRLTSNLNVLIQGQGQLASGPLLSSEEFGVGGFGLGRGYDSSEIIGDDGIAGSVELQWNEPKTVPYVNDYQLYTFFDTGRVWNKDATTASAKRESLSSTGVGFRADITDKTKAGFAVGFPLTRDVETTGNRGPRYYFNVSHEF